MSALSIGILVVFLIEVYYISKIVLDIRKMDRDSPLMLSLQKKNGDLQTEILGLRKSIDDARKENEGINFLWNRTIKENSQLRNDLEVAEKQLRYLAQKVVNGEPLEARHEAIFWKTESKEVQHNALHEMTML